jgi:phenylpropionate dioxygenase-like ring-hydroxylating dioxygenase large terminal subunit
VSSAADPGAHLARTLPGRFYHDPAIWEREQERLFGRLWVCVGRADQFDATGRYRTVRVGDESVLLVRDEAGALRAFLNVCRHRGAQLCPAAEGQTRTVRCRYHAWTYGLDGRLLRAPGLQDSATFDRGAFGLVRVALETWEGLVWVNLAENPSPLADQLTPQIVDRLGDAARLAPYRIGALAVGRTIEYEVRANWKVVVENFMECYHCAPMHPELVRRLPAFRSGATQEYGLGTRLADDAEALTMSGRAPGPPFPGLAPGHERHYYGMVVRPNLLLNLLPDHVIVHTLAPLAPDRSRVICDWLFAPEVVARVGFDPEDTVGVFDRVNRQDWEVCEWVQAGVRSRAFAAGGVYVGIERHIRGFNDWVLDQLGLPAESPVPESPTPRA